MNRALFCISVSEGTRRVNVCCVVCAQRRSRPRCAQTRVMSRTFSNTGRTGFQITFTTEYNVQDTQILL